jgi:ATP-dependent DNA ligase
MIDYFYPPQPTRIWPNANLFMTLSANSNWDAEIKYNGWRLLIFKEKSNKFFNRHGTLIDMNTEIFNHHFESVPNYTVFDCELVEFRTKALKNIIVIFDVPFYDGIDLRNKPLKDRRLHFENFLEAPLQLAQKEKSQVYRIRQFQKDLVKLYSVVIDKNDPSEEGIVLKNKLSIYRTHPKKGKEVKDWYKIKKIGDHALVSH